MMLYLLHIAIFYNTGMIVKLAMAFAHYNILAIDTSYLFLLQLFNSLLILLESPATFSRLLSIIILRNMLKLSTDFLSSSDFITLSRKYDALSTDVVSESSVVLTSSDSKLCFFSSSRNVTFFIGNERTSPA